MLSIRRGKCMKETFLIYFMLAKVEFSSEVTAIELIEMFMDFDDGISANLYWVVG